MIKYVGTPESKDYDNTGRVDVVVDDETRRPLVMRLGWRNHSPTGFAWGYGGSGPAQLALAILADASNGNKELTLANYQRFKADVVAHLPRGPWELSIVEVRGWIDANVGA